MSEETPAERLARLDREDLEAAEQLNRDAADAARAAYAAAKRRTASAQPVAAPEPTQPAYVTPPTPEPTPDVPPPNPPAPAYGAPPAPRDDASQGGQTSPPADDQLPSAPLETSNGPVVPTPAIPTFGFNRPRSNEGTKPASAVPNFSAHGTEPAPQPRTVLTNLSSDDSSAPAAPGTLPDIDFPRVVVRLETPAATPLAALGGIPASAAPLPELPELDLAAQPSQSTLTPEGTQMTQTQQPASQPDPTNAAQAAPVQPVASAPASTPAPAPVVAPTPTPASVVASTPDPAAAPAPAVPPAQTPRPADLEAAVRLQQLEARAAESAAAPTPAAPVPPTPAAPQITVNPVVPAANAAGPAAPVPLAPVPPANAAAGPTPVPPAPVAPAANAAGPAAPVPPAPVPPAQRRNGCCLALGACGCLAALVVGAIGLSVGGYKMWQNKQTVDVAPILSYTTLDAALAAVKGAGNDVGQLLPIVGGIRNSTALSLDDRIGATYQASIAVPTTMTEARFGRTVTVDGVAEIQSGAYGELDSNIIEKFTALKGKTANEVLREARAITTLGYTVKQDGNTIVVELNGDASNVLKPQGQMVLELKNGTLDSLATREDAATNGTALTHNLQNRGSVGWVEGHRVESRGGANVDLAGTDGTYVRQLLQNEYNVTTAANSVLIFGDANGQNYAWTNEGRGVALGHRDLGAEARANSALVSARTGNFGGLRQQYETATETQKAEARQIVLTYLRSNDFAGQKAYVGVRHIRQGPQRELGVSGPLGTINATDLARAVEQNVLDMDDMLEALAERPSAFVPSSQRVRGEDDIRAEARRYEALIDRNFVDMGVLGMNADLVPYVKRLNGTSIRSWDGLHRELGDAQGGGQNGHLRLYLRIGN